jgi:hypothetical protein
MVTRSQARAQFDHICNVVLCRDDESILKKTLVQEGFDTIPSLLAIGDNTFSSLAGCDQTLVTRKGDMALIWSFRNYVVSRAASGITVKDEWLTMTAEGFNAFQVRCLGMRFATSHDEDEWLGMTAEDLYAFRVRSISSFLGTPRSTAVETTTTGPTPRPLVAIDHHGAKRDDGAFPAPKNECWPGPTIPPLTLSPLASSPSKNNGITAVILRQYRRGNQHVLTFGRLVVVS